MVIVLTGCGPKTTSVLGTVTIDGKPAKDIRVIFQSVTQEKIAPEAATGVTNVNGQFTLSLIESKKTGCIPGEYAVFFRWIDPLEKLDESKPQKTGPYKIPPEAQNGSIRYTVLSNGVQEARFDF
jgi:5-hydroxyisourate hydrolase-like protein (transthyretin family)